MSADRFPAPPPRLAADGTPLRAVPPHRPGPSLRTDAADPLLAELLAGADDGAAERFWAAVAERGTPLVSPAPAGAPDGTLLVTFVWREPDPAAVTVLQVNRLFDPTDPGGSVLRTVPGTDVRHLAYLLPREWRGSYRFVTVDHVPAAGAGVAERTAFRENAARTGRPDPLNPRLATASGGLSLAELPGAPAQPWFAARDGVPRGALTEHRIGSAALGAERPVWLHVPAGRHDGPLPLLVLFDGRTWVEEQPIGPTLDNLVAEGAMPPVCTVLVDTLDTATRTRELTCDPRFAAFVVDELVPWVAARRPVTDDPRRTIAAGQSLGGLAAAYLAHVAPERFGAVSSLSGGFWFPHHAGDDGAAPGAEWLTGRVAAAPPTTRYHLAVGTREWVSLPPNRRFRDAALAAGNDVDYHEYEGGHDTVCWRGELAEGLRRLTRDW